MYMHCASTRERAGPANPLHDLQLDLPRLYRYLPPIDLQGDQSPEHLPRLSLHLPLGGALHVHIGRDVILLAIKNIDNLPGTVMCDNLFDFAVDVLSVDDYCCVEVLWEEVSGGG